MNCDNRVFLSPNKSVFRLVSSDLIAKHNDLIAKQMAKSVLDGMNKIVYEDDAQVVRKITCKFYGDKTGT